MLQPPPPIVKSALPHVFTPNGDTFNEVFKVGPPRGGLSLIITVRVRNYFQTTLTAAGQAMDMNQGFIFGMFNIPDAPGNPDLRGALLRCNDSPYNAPMSAAVNSLALDLRDQKLMIRYSNQPRKGNNLGIKCKLAETIISMLHLDRLILSNAGRE